MMEGMRVVAAGVAVAWLLGVSPALAQPGGTFSARAEPERVRYGATIAVIDGVAAGVIGLGALMIARDDSREVLSSGVVKGGVLVVIGGGIFLVGGPAVHARKHNRSSAWTSVATRIVVPGAGALLGYYLDEERKDCDGGYCGPDVFGPTLTILGAAGAMAFDWFVLAEVEVTPYVAPAPGGGTTVGLAGAF
jgi:hypothetical protein